MRSIVLHALDSWKKWIFSLTIRIFIGENQLYLAHFWPYEDQYSMKLKYQNQFYLENKTHKIKTKYF